MIREILEAFSYIDDVETKLKKYGFKTDDKDSSYVAMNDGNNGISYSYGNGTHKFTVEKQGERARLFNTSDDYQVDNKIEQIIKYLES